MYIKIKASILDNLVSPEMTMTQITSTEEEKEISGVSLEVQSAIKIAASRMQSTII